MKKVININFQGRVVPIEESAYDILKAYIESLRTYFQNEEGRDEIINDIEGRIAELFSEVLQKGTTCITDENVYQIIDSMGRPEDFEAEESNVKSQLSGEPRVEETAGEQKQQSRGFTFATQAGHKLYRDENNKILGGVAAGVANYFGIDRIIVRIIFIVAAGVLFLPYIILWIAVPSSATQVIGSVRKRLFRDPDTKWIGGVGAGLGHYFGISPWIPRLLFLIPFLSVAFRWGHWGMFDVPHFFSLSFSPGATILYIILWLVIPEAITAADKLEMKGEKVDLNNIKNTIQSDLEGFKDRAERWSKEVSQTAEKFGQNVAATAQQAGAQVAPVARQTSRGLGWFIGIIVKAFVYFILAVILFSIVASLFAVGVTFIGLTPVMDFVLRDGWQTTYAWGTLIFFIWVPIIAILTWLVRRITRSKRNSQALGWGFGALWTLGWVCMTLFVSSVVRDFKYRNNTTETIIPLAQPQVNKLEVTANKTTKYYSDRDWFKIEPFGGLYDDTAFVNNIIIRVQKAEGTEFKIRKIAYSNGRTKTQARELADKIEFGVTQKDTLLYLDKGIAVNREDKFRNQRVMLIIEVPVGKKIMIDNKAAFGSNVRISINDRDEDWSNWTFDWDDSYERWAADVEYIMTEKGLEPVDPNYKDKKKKKRRNYDYEEEEDTFERYKKSREELEREIQEQENELKRKEQELLEKKKELKEKPDSGKYRYQRAEMQLDQNNLCKNTEDAWPQRGIMASSK